MLSARILFPTRRTRVNFVTAGWIVGVKKQGDWARVKGALVNRRANSLLRMKSLSGIQRVRVEGVRIDCDEEEKD